MDQSWPTFYDLLTAYKSCRLHKPASTSQIRFESKLAENLNHLSKAIHSSKYIPAPAKYFVVTQPKPREIFAADFKDRVVHHLVVTQLEPIWNRKFIHASFACRLGKGSHGAIQHVQKKVRIISRGGVDPVWCLQLDIEKFFVSINRPILCDLLLKYAVHTKLRELIQTIYGHDARMTARKLGAPSLFDLIPQGKSWFEQEDNFGIPIGNLTSQFGATVYLTALDHFVQRDLKPSSYQRYMDDLLLLDRDPEKLKAMAEPIDQWLQSHRKQCLNPSKTTLTCLTQGIRYLGYVLRQTGTPAQPLQLFSEPLKKWKFIQALKKLERMPTPLPKRPHFLAPAIYDVEALQEISSVNSRMGSLVHANTYRFRKKALQKFFDRTKENREIPEELTDHWSPYEIKKDYRAVRLW